MTLSERGLQQAIEQAQCSEGAVRADVLHRMWHAVAASRRAAAQPPAQAPSVPRIAPRTDGMVAEAGVAHFPLGRKPVLQLPIAMTLERLDL